MTEVNPKLHKELQGTYSDLRDILNSFPPEADEENYSSVEKMKAYDKKITTTYGMIEDLQQKVGKILDDIQVGKYD